MCDLEHIPGAGCIKCTGVTSGILRGEKLQREFPTVPAPKNVQVDSKGQVEKCNACAAGLAQHKVNDVGEGATGPDAVQDAQMLCTCPDKEEKARKFYVSEWAGRTAPDGTKVPQLAVCEGPLGGGYPAQPSMTPAMAHPN